MGRGEPVGTQGLGRGPWGVLSHLQSNWAPFLGCGPLLPPGGRGAGVSWEGRSRGRVGLGAGRRRLGGGEGGSGRPTPGRGPAGWPRAWPGRATSAPTSWRGARRARSPASTGRPLPAGGARLALIGAAGRGRRELARATVSIRDAKFLLGRRRRQAQCLGEQERWEVPGIGSTPTLGPPLGLHPGPAPSPVWPLFTPLSRCQGDAHLHVSAFSTVSGLCGWPGACAIAPFSLARQS